MRRGGPQVRRGGLQVRRGGPQVRRGGQGYTCEEREGGKEKYTGKQAGRHAEKSLPTPPPSHPPCHQRGSSVFGSCLLCRSSHACTGQERQLVRLGRPQALSRAQACVNNPAANNHAQGYGDVSSPIASGLG